jgi:hypothetical protein
VVQEGSVAWYLKEAVVSPGKHTCGVVVWCGVVWVAYIQGQIPGGGYIPMSSYRV